MTGYGWIRGALLACSVWLAGGGLAHAAEMDLRVLLVAVGDSSVDPGRAVAEQILDKLGMPYEVVDSSRTTLTNSILRSGSRGRFNGVVLTQSETILPNNGGVGFTAAEFALLYQYERDFGVREAVLSGFPATNPSLGLDYGMGSISWGNNVLGRWQAPAGGTELFEHVNVQNVLPTEGFTFLATPRGGPGPVVEPVLVNEDDPAYGLVFRISYPDGRKVLLSIVNNATFFLHTSVIASEFIHFATSGVHFGARRVYLSLHNDDMFLADEVWNPETESNHPEDIYNYRMQAWEVPVVAQAHAAFRARHPLASQIITELAYNGVGAASNDPLTTALRQAGTSFAYINHTYSALQMDRLCPGLGLEQSGGGGLGGLFDWLLGGWATAGNTVNGCRTTDYTTAYNEISRNQQVWRNFNFPGYDAGRTVLLTDSHSGLSDRRGTPDDPADDIVFPDGFNDNFGRAATALGVRTIAADASRPNQDRIQRVPGHQLVILPRYPTSLFYNTTTPAELESEYNYIHHFRYLDAGQDPCAIPGAICTPRSYEQILEAEAVTTLRHMLAGDPFPHYFHQTNLHVYDQNNNILQVDWMEAVVSAYEKWLKLPIQSPRFHELGELAWRGIEAREAGITGTYDNVRRQVTLRANRSATIEMTGIQGGTLHGGHRVRSLDLIPFFSRTYSVDQALTQ